jgi:hypothetical protein
VSTSGSLESAEEFSTYYLDEAAGGGASDGLPPERIAVAEVTVPAGTRAIDMQSVWVAQTDDPGLEDEEQETLLNRDTMFTVTEATVDDIGRYRIKVRAG